MKKRFIDVVVAATLLLFTSPLLLTGALLVRVTMGSPVLFRQRRPGRNGEIFEIVKLRTMKPARSAADADDDRLTAAGRLLRSTSIDELPQLANVLRGEMSLVGPRPLLPEYLDRYSPYQARRHEVRPGLTGWAQINGRNDTSWEERLELDVWYVDHRSTWLDCRILGKTVLHVLGRRGATTASGSTMEAFGS